MLKDLRPELNEVLDFMLDNMEDLPTVYPQHIIEHFHNSGQELTLVYATSLLRTHLEELNVTEHNGGFTLTIQGKLLAQIGGYKDQPEDFDDTEEE